MKNKIILFIFLVLTGTAFSQTTGYMGKRLSIGYSNYLSPSLLNPSANTTESQSLGLNATHCVNIEYSIKLRTNFCFGIQFFKTGVDRSSGYTYSYYEPNGDYYGQGTAIYHSSTKIPMQLRTTNISLGFKFFGEGYIAPVGKYKKLEFILLMDKLNYDKKAFYNYAYAPENRVATSLGTGEYDFKSFAVALTFGRQRVFFNTLIIDTGFRFGISPNYVLNFIKNDILDSSSSGLSMEDQLRQSVNQRILGSQLLNFHIGIGFLAF